MNRLAVGTVQFGQNYGISNKTGKVSEKQALKILEFALKNGVKTVDTAYSYGNSEQTLGKFNKLYPNGFEIVSKLPSITARSLDYYLKTSLKRLQVDRIYGYLIHDFSFFLKNKYIIKELKGFQKMGLINKFGFSIYYPNELEYLISRKIPFDIIQFPYSVFDQRFAVYIPLLKKRGIIIHTRSAFLQGAVFLDPYRLRVGMKSLKSRLIKLNELSKSTKISIASLCLNFVLENQYIDKAIIGLNSLSDLKKNLKYMDEYKDVLKSLESLLELRTNNRQIIIPSSWKK